MAMSVAIADASATTTAQTPATAESEVEPQRSSARNEKSRRGSRTSDISRLTLTTTTRRQERPSDGRFGVAVPPATDLSRIELACGGGELAHDRIVRCSLDRRAVRSAVALAGAASGALRPTQPPQAESQHDGRCDDPQTGRGEWRGAEKWHRDRILNRWRSRQG